MEPHVHEQLDEHGYCRVCQIRVMTHLKGFPLPDRPCDFAVNHKYPLGYWCWTHSKYEHEH